LKESTRGTGTCAYVKGSVHGMDRLAFADNELEAYLGDADLSVHSSRDRAIGADIENTHMGIRGKRNARIED
jgi:hypothetical protein